MAQGYALLQRYHYGRQALALPPIISADLFASRVTTLNIPAITCDRIRGLPFGDRMGVDRAGRDGPNCSMNPGCVVSCAANSSSSENLRHDAFAKPRSERGGPHFPVPVHIIESGNRVSRHRHTVESGH